MAKPSKPLRTEPAATSSVSESDSIVALPNESIDKPIATVAPTSNIKKDMTQTRLKKQNSATPKSGTLLPSAYKLEHLKAAVAAAGSIEKLLLILNHVEEAGGKSEVSENIETYRVLKTVLEE